MNTNETNSRVRVRNSANDQPDTDHLDTSTTQRHRSLLPQVSRPLAYLLLAGVFTYGMLGTTLPTPLYVLYQAQYRFSSALITVIFAAYALGVLAALLMFGHASDHFGRRPVLLAGLLLACVSTVLFVFAQNVPVLLVARVLSGLGAGLLTGTATAELVELEPTGNHQRAARVATAANIGGLGLGPLVAGLFAQLRPDPTRLVFIVYLIPLVVALLLVYVLPETVKAPDYVLDLRPRLSVPSAMRAPFVEAALAGFCVFALMGLFNALAPSFLRGMLHNSNLIVAGAVVCLLFIVTAAAQVFLNVLPIWVARLAGRVLLLLALALIGLGLVLSSFALFIVGTVVGGLGAGLAFAESLATINRIAPPQQRAAMVSAFFVAAYGGLSVPVVGVGLLAQRTNLLVAALCLEFVIALLLLLSLAAVLRSGRRAAVKSGSR
jgi:Arabinose efflux permease